MLGFQLICVKSDAVEVLFVWLLIDIFCEEQDWSSEKLYTDITFYMVYHLKLNITCT